MVWIVSGIDSDELEREEMGLRVGMERFVLAWLGLVREGGGGIR